ncbi:MAG: imidazoleglycerol-phosphate dehydratase HisB [Candidatus Omnitrophica bacterium]|nr:imidazoleglycerol-phosphate dehydratase HisB [Candidatus Omnitrophota bacterium]
MGREAKISRKTKETNIAVTLRIDGAGNYAIATGIPFLNHMLDLFAKHGLFDLTIEAEGDLEVDIHHTNEDVGIALGEAFAKALAGKEGIRRFGSAIVPMDEALARVALDISNRPSVYCELPERLTSLKGEAYAYTDLMSFLKAFVAHAGINLHIDIVKGDDLHHSFEAAFKGLAKALDMATQIDPRSKGVPSTKGLL